MECRELLVTLENEHRYHWEGDAGDYYWHTIIAGHLDQISNNRDIVHSFKKINPDLQTGDKNIEL